jgi:hypothetical protein
LLGEKVRKGVTCRSRLRHIKKKTTINKEKQVATLLAPSHVCFSVL